jgi:hypothetical protein
VPASGLTYRVVVHGDDLVVDVNFQRGDYEREWVRYKGNRLARACIKPRGGSYRCGSTARTLGLDSADYGDLRQVRDGYVASLLTAASVKSLRTSGKVNDVRMDPRLGFPIVCAIPNKGQSTRLCVQENGFITQWRAGDTRINATNLRVAASEADLRAPA